jgi:hypothetical protein
VRERCAPARRNPPWSLAEASWWHHSRRRRHRRCGWRRRAPSQHVGHVCCNTLWPVVEPQAAEVGRDGDDEHLRRVVVVMCEAVAVVVVERPGWRRESKTNAQLVKQNSLPQRGKMGRTTERRHGVRGNIAKYHTPMQQPPADAHTNSPHTHERARAHAHTRAHTYYVRRIPRCSPEERPCRAGTRS